VGVPSKKSKLVGGVLSRGTVGGSSPVPTTSAMSSDAWESLVIEVDPSELVTNVLDAADADDLDKVVSFIFFFIVGFSLPPRFICNPLSSYYILIISSKI
jgi:hypothetical protein